jgi:hypothetical protein
MVPATYPDRRVFIFGLGYVGLKLAMVLADIGFEVIGIEIYEDVFVDLRRGVPHFHEPERGTAVLENAGHDYMAGFSLAAVDAPGRAVTATAVNSGGEDGRLPPFRRLAERFVAAERERRTYQPGFAAGARVRAQIAALRG